ncbi:DUF11 domain-containing protein [Rubripirellula amarantea]|nr:DUF11 domain-containing protein [Rubripirellula amarantea]
MNQANAFLAPIGAGMKLTGHRRCVATIGALVCGLMIGCATSNKPSPSGFRMPGGKAPAMPTSTGSGMPGSPVHPVTPSYPGPTDSTHSTSTQGPSGIQQVNYEYVGDYPSSDCGTPDLSFGVSGGCTAGCCASGSCASGSCAPAQVIPHGYAPSAGMMNVYGVDPQEFLCDGGDQHGDARVLRDESIDGLQPEDTIVHYTTEAGDIEVVPSNRVCVYAPRFKSVRKITGVRAGEHAVGLAGVDLPVGTNRIEIEEGGVMIGESIELGHADVARRLDAMRERNRGVPVEGIAQIEQATDVLALLVGMKFDQISLLQEDQKAMLEELALAAVAWTIDESVEVEIQDLKTPVLTRDQSVEGFTIYEFPDAGRLRICKLADRHDALPGELINFAIRIENVGDSAVDQVLITDNLVTRLEYVAESQTCSVGAEFETVVNEGQSLQLIWKLTDKLRVGESATMRFRCKVR